MKIFLICPVRNATEAQKAEMTAYIERMESYGHSVYYPARDTDQSDLIGIRICSDNARAIEQADEVHIFWDPESKGSLFDLGIAWGLRKPLVVVNRSAIDLENHKSFHNVIAYWNTRKAGD